MFIICMIDLIMSLNWWALKTIRRTLPIIPDPRCLKTHQTRDCPSWSKGSDLRPDMFRHAWVQIPHHAPHPLNSVGQSATLIRWKSPVQAWQWVADLKRLKLIRTWNVSKLIRQKASLNFTVDDWNHMSDVAQWKRVWWNGQEDGGSKPPVVTCGYRVS
jgi:hypothetical protein